MAWRLRQKPLILRLQRKPSAGVSERGSDANPVIAVANFSDFETPDPFNGVSEYVVPNWPGRTDFLWREVSQGRDVPPEWVGREPLFRWEVKVYAHR